MSKDLKKLVERLAEAIAEINRARTEIAETRRALDDLEDMLDQVAPGV